MLDISSLSQDSSFFIKIAVLIVLFMFTVFTLVILNQIRTMNRIITQSVVSSVLFLVALGLVFASMSLFLLATVIL